MGTNRRYAHRIDERMDRKIEESEMRPHYESLPVAVTETDKDHPVKPETPVPVDVWVPVTAGKVKIQAVAVEWNKKAARVEWQDSDGTNRSIWVYLGAIKRR